MEAETKLELKSWGISISKAKTTVLLIAVADLELLPQGTGDTVLSQYKQGWWLELSKTLISVEV